VWRELSATAASFNVMTAGVPGTLIESAAVRDSVIMAACAAASAVADPAVGDRDAAARLMECLGVVSAAFPIGMAPSLGDFRRKLGEPLRNLLPSGLDPGPVGDMVLLDTAGRLRDEADDLCQEHFVPVAALEEHWSLSRIRAEQEEQQLYRELRSLGPARYVTGRELLVGLPAGELRALRRAWDDLWPRFGGYRPVTEMGRVQVEGWWFPCPTCRWPMRADAATGGVWRVRCEAHAARGVAYTTRPADWRGRPALAAAGKDAGHVEGQPATADHLAVSRPVWRYVTLPGILETGLRDHAEALGAEVSMWPNLDELDLVIRLGGKTWRIDAKAWASPVALAQALLASEPPAQLLHIVIPDHQRPARSALNDMLKGRRMTALTARDMKTLLDRAAGRDAL
jgi:hypothetical protein